MVRLNKVALMAAVGVSFSVAAKADEGADIASWVALDAPTGHEHHGSAAILKKFKGWRVDKTGNVLKTTGSGAGHTVVACFFDAPSFAITQITEKGYLRLHNIGRGSRHPLWSQAHEGQQVKILTDKGPVIGVTAASNGHFLNLHRHETALVRTDDLWVDVGATNAANVRDMGIKLLDPLVRNIPAWSYANEIAGPSAGARTGCAALVAGAEANLATKGKVTWMLSTQSSFNMLGFSAGIANIAKTGDKVDGVLLLERGAAEAKQQTTDSLGRRIDPVLKSAGVKSIERFAPKVSDAGALMERITLSDANSYLSMIMTALGVSKAPQWVSAPENAAPINDKNASSDRTLNVFGDKLDELAEISATPGHEGPIRAKVIEDLPKWAKDIVETDDMGNVWLDVGPRDTEATVFMAHMDEVGYEVKSIDADGTVNLTRKGGALNYAWEGQPALLQLDAGKGAQSAATVKNLKGIFNTRNDAKEKRPETITAWFGMDAAGLEKAGVMVGMGLTGYKEGHRMGAYRYSARGMDDRVGTTALLMAVKSINPRDIKHRVIFSWSVQEEGGLNGAQALANKYGLESKRIYSIDTFVSSDTPLEEPHFAYAPLGEGPVLRSIENSGMAIPYELNRNKSVAKKAGIKVQIGQTQGGTDGTTFTYWGAPNAGLSWPGRYSHGPAEIADLRDATKLVELIKAFVLADPN